MSVAFFLGSISFVLWLLLTVLYVVEDRRGSRIVLPGARAFFDQVLFGLSLRAARYFHWATRGFLRILLHYGFHRLLQRLLRFVQRIEHWIERIMRQNRAVAKQVKAERQFDQSGQLSFPVKYDSSSHKER